MCYDSTCELLYRSQSKLCAIESGECGMYRDVSGMRAEKIERISKTYAMREYLMFSNEADVVKESRKRKASVLLVQGDISMF